MATIYTLLSTMIGKLNGKLNSTALPSAINTALAQAKASGEFDGEKGAQGPAGYTPVKGLDYYTDSERAALIADVQAKANQQTPLFANSVSECTDTSKVYVLPDGYLYGYVMTPGEAPEITIESGDKGYWYADEWNMEKWVSNSSVSMKKTNLIPVTPGDKFSYKGQGDGTNQHSVAWFDANQKYLSEETYSAKGAAITITAPANAAYGWFSSYEWASTAANVVLEVKWVLCQAAVPSYQWTSTGHAFVPADYEDRILALEEKTEGLEEDTTDVLKGKKIVYDGDSICQGYNAGGGYPALIASTTGGTAVNQAVGGCRLSAYASGHSVVNNLSNLPTDGDLYCFQGGINDWWGNVAIGECSMTDYTGTVNTATICGAMETIFRYVLTNFVGKPICFVITHKVQNSAYTTNSNGDSFWDYREAMIKVCEKYSIPYYDAFCESGLNGWNTAQNNAYLTGNGAGTADGIHPNAEGYKRYYVPQLITLFRSMMPVDII